MRSLCKKEGIIFQAYASLGAGSLGLCLNPVVGEVSLSANMSPGQVLLRWAVQKGCAVLPKSSQVKNCVFSLVLHSIVFLLVLMGFRFCTKNKNECQFIPRSRVCDSMPSNGQE